MWALADPTGASSNPVASTSKRLQAARMTRQAFACANLGAVASHVFSPIA